MSLEQHETNGPIIPLKQALIETTFKQDRVYEGADTLGLGTLQPAIEELRAFTLSHPDRHEAVRIIYVTPDRRVITNRRIVPGGNRNAGLFSYFYVDNSAASRDKRQDKFIGSIAHSHPYDSPLSPSDLLELFYPDSALDASTSATVITPERIILVFRGQNTPSLGKSEAQDYLERLDNAVMGRINRFVIPGMTTEEMQNVSIKANTAMFNQIAVKHDLQVFEGQIGSEYLHRIAA